MAASTATKADGKANLIVTAGALSVLAVIGGGLVGKLAVSRLRGTPASAAAGATAAALPYLSTLEVRELTPVVVNLADPPSARVRLQAAVVFAKGSVAEPAPLIAEITDDIVAFVKSLSLRELQGASGLQNLREDLNERAAVRSQGKVREVVIEGLVVVE